MKVELFCTRNSAAGGGWRSVGFRRSDGALGDVDVELYLHEQPAAKQFEVGQTYLVTIERACP